jgi:hypothetical protein
MPLAVTIGRFVGRVAGPTAIPVDGVLTTALNDERCGMLMTDALPNSAVALFRLEGGTLTVISADSVWTKHKDQNNKCNAYFEDGYLCIQNKTAEEKTVRVNIYGF